MPTNPCGRIMLAVMQRALIRGKVICRGFAAASSDSQRLAGKIAVITGGASGIGKATAEEFVKNGAKVIIADVQDELGHAVAGELGHDAVIYTRCDVADEADIAAAVDLAVSRHGRLDVMVNNAGISGDLAPTPVSALDLADFDRVMEVNARSTLAGVKHAARVMTSPRRSGGGGSIICTASIAGVMGGVAIPHYSVSKAAVVGIVRAVAGEMARHGVRVNAVSPSYVATPMAMGAMAAWYPGASVEERRRIVEREMNETVEGVTLEVGDVAMAAVFLASDEAKFVNGHNLVVDGGYTVGKGDEESCWDNNADFSCRFNRQWLLHVIQLTPKTGRQSRRDHRRGEWHRQGDGGGSDVAAAVDLAVARHGRLDVFHSNAGICGTIPNQDDVARVDMDEFDRIMSVNARAVVAAIKHAARAMAPRRDGGAVIVTSSGAGVTPVCNIPLYSISKAAAIAAVRATAEPMARLYGLRVNAISPGGVRTPLMRSVFADMMAGASEEAVRMVTEREDMMEPEFIARAALYLASDDAKFVNGHNLVVDSGYSVYKGAGTPPALIEQSAYFEQNVQNSTTPRQTSPDLVNGFSTAALNSGERLAGKVAVITGAASGIGKATAAEFIKNGAKVILADVQDDLGRAVAAELGPDASYTRCDVADESQIAAAVDLAVARHGRLDVMFNNAGILGAIMQDDMASLDMAAFDRIMAVNARSTLAGVKHAARVMSGRGGVVLCTSSVAGVLPNPISAIYSVSKATVLAVVRAAAAPMARHGVRVNAISPHGTRTPMAMRVLAEMCGPGAGEEELRRMADAAANAGVAMEPEHIAMAAVYLASDEAKYVTGHNLVVDGGFTVHKAADAGNVQNSTTPPQTSPGLVNGFSTAAFNSGERLAGKVALITGAASGIGKATAAEFIKNGAKVILADVQDDLGHAVAAELGPDATYTRCDVADESQIAAAVDLAVSRHGHLDILYNNAGIQGAMPQDDMASLDMAEFDRVMAVNARSTLAGVKHAARVMSLAAAGGRGGVVLCTSSVAGVLPIPISAIYSVSKATVIAVVRAAAAPMARHGVRVNAISPHGTRTPMMMRVLAEMCGLGVGEEEVRRMADAAADAGVAMEPEYIARAAVYLASDEAKYVTGHNLVVDGGFTVHKSADAGVSAATN
uniref:Ketoreductase domain-containing protein n=1 Tax=Leersia perrieri TaxID=77586 RepID=A0A0D9X2K5_9ORYZ